MWHRPALALECLPYTSRRRQRRLARAVRDLRVARCACLCRWSPSGPFGGWARDDRRACRPHAPPLSLSRTIACHCIVRRPDALVWTCTPDAASCFTSPRLLRKAQKPARACDQQIAPTASPPPRLPPRMPPVVNQYTHRRCGAGGGCGGRHWCTPVDGWQLSGGSSTRMRGCEHAGGERSPPKSDVRN